MKSAPRRRSLRFAFSLRTLFVVVTIFGVWLGWQLSIVRERRAILQDLDRASLIPAGDGSEVTLFSHLELEWAETNRLPAELDKYFKDREYQRISRIRRLMGDKSVLGINFSADIDPLLIERTEYAFPEANLEAIAGIVGKHAERCSLYVPHRTPNVGTIFKTGLIEK